MNSEIAIEANGLEKTYHDPQRGTVQAVRGIDLDCRSGEIYGLLGPNGAGKTTTLRMLSTILAPSAGSARVAGVDVAADPLEVRRRIGFLSGSTGLYPRLTARETLEYFGRLHGLEEDALQGRVDELLDRFRMRPFQDGRCEGLSTGQRQRVSIARAVVHDPPVLILDEPTVGLDPLQIQEILHLITDLAAPAQGAQRHTVILSTHILAEVEAICRRVIMLHGGRKTVDAPLEELTSGGHSLEELFARQAGGEDEVATGAEASA